MATPATKSCRLDGEGGDPEVSTRRVEVAWLGAAQARREDGGWWARPEGLAAKHLVAGFVMSLQCSALAPLDALTAVLLAAMDEDDLDLRLRVGSAREENLSLDRSTIEHPLRVRASSPASELAATKAREGAGLHGMDTAAAATTGELASPASSVGQEGPRPSRHDRRGSPVLSRSHRPLPGP